MSINRLIESLGLPAHELRRYVLAEIDEFLEADDPAHREEEFGDILFALASMGWAHAGRHYRLDPEVFEAKLAQRLRTCAAVTRHPRRYLHDRIPELDFGVVHFAFGRFAGQWKEFDPLPNGTLAEISMLTDAPYRTVGNLTNHCILTFDDTPCLEYELLGAAGDVLGGNTVLCRIPDFLYARAKRDLAFGDSGRYLALQVLAALDGLCVKPNAIAHFHSWEGGFLADSTEFSGLAVNWRTLFSPYLTIGPLKSLVDASGGTGWTMSPEELVFAAGYEEKLAAFCQRTVLESGRDRDWYERPARPGRIDIRSFARVRRTSYPSAPRDGQRLSFVAGGRPVREKGFVELCREFARVRDWAAARGIEASLSLLCREPRPDKGHAYIEEIERTVDGHDLRDHVRIDAKVSVDMLRRKIGGAAGLIVPSLFDPFCLMPTYALEVATPVFVSRHAGVSENLQSTDFVFDPLVPGDLTRAIDVWYRKRPLFQYEARFPGYESLYLDDGSL